MSINENENTNNANIYEAVPFTRIPPAIEFSVEQIHCTFYDPANGHNKSHTAMKDVIEPTKASIRLLSETTTIACNNYERDDCDDSRNKNNDDDYGRNIM